MEPTFKNGDLVVGWRWFRPAPGQAVIVSTQQPLLKRLQRIEAGKVWLVGDNPADSLDSRQLGAFPADQLCAKILFKL